VVVVFIFGITGMSFAADPEEENIREITVVINFNPNVPKPIDESLHSVISATLNDVLIAKKPGGIAAIRQQIEQVGLAIREGLNVVLEPKGFVVSDVQLDVGSITNATVSIIPAGGLAGEGGPVCTDVELVLATENIPEFWRETLLREFEPVKEGAVEKYSAYLVGLPLAVTDKDFILEAVGPYVADVEPLSGTFPDFNLHTRLELGKTSRIFVTLSPSGTQVQRLRVRMTGATIPNVVLDSMREAVTSHSEIVVGLPETLVMANLGRIADYYEGLIETDKMAEVFHAKAKVGFRYDREDNSLIAICEVNSTAYDVELKGYIDFGNEDVDSGEVEGWLGYFFFRDVELLFVLNLYTNDMTLEPDALLGWRPSEGTFLAGGYDIEARARKFFFKQRIADNLFFEGEIFAENDRNQLGVSYQFHQYFAGGLYATGDGDYWFRSTFKL